MKSFKYTIKDELGIHARPAGLLIKEARKYKSNILINFNGKQADCTKLISVMGLTIKCGDTVDIEVNGEDEAEAAKAIEKLFIDNL